MRAKVLVIYTGGTIGMVPEDAADPASPLVPAGRERLARAIVNSPADIDWDLTGLADGAGGTLPPLDSSGCRTRPLDGAGRPRSRRLMRGL